MNQAHPSALHHGCPHRSPRPPPTIPAATAPSDTSLASTCPTPPSRSPASDGNQVPTPPRHQRPYKPSTRRTRRSGHPRKASRQGRGVAKPGRRSRPGGDRSPSTQATPHIPPSRADHHQHTETLDASTTHNHTRRSPRAATPCRLVNPHHSISIVDSSTHARRSVHRSQAPNTIHYPGRRLMVWEAKKGAENRSSALPRAHRFRPNFVRLRQPGPVAILRLGARRTRAGFTEGSRCKARGGVGRAVPPARAAWPGGGGGGPGQLTAGLHSCDSPALTARN